MPDVLRFVPFAAELLEDVRDFDYGDESFQKELADWLRTDSLPALASGVKIWLYVNQSGDIIGYSSLGVSRWKYPDPSSHRIEVVIVPAVAVRKQFWGKPDGAERDDRYSSQIMRHLLDEAEQWPGQPPVVGLFVHPDNVAAIRLYERFGFQTFHRAPTRTKPRK